jgi:phosphoribosylglycinamide formyltransferase-1
VSGASEVRLAVLVSGTGSILQSMLADGLPVAFVLADRACRGLEVAAEAGVAAELVDRSAWGGFGASFERESYTTAVTRALVTQEIDLIAMAGYGTVLAQPIHDAFPMRILNTHPALLPAFPGWHAVADALKAGATETGCTVHYAVLEMDAGPIVAQQAVPVLPDDTEETLHERIKDVERRLYPEAIRTVMDEISRVWARRVGSRGVSSRGVGPPGVGSPGVSG